MKLLDFIRLIRKHIILVVTIPVLLAVLTIVLTSKPNLNYTSHTILYTGIATGSSIEMDKTFNYFVTNTAFDNLINIINARSTHQEIAIRLLSQHLLLGKADPKYISEKSYEELKKITPPAIYQYVVHHGIQAESSLSQDDTAKATSFRKLFPKTINEDDYELTVRNLTALMESSDTNFVYKLLNYEHPHYSINAISTVKATRIANSDLIKLTYEVDDPGICQQTLALFNEICIKNYKNIRENRSDDIIGYFEAQLNDANKQLKESEDKLLSYNMSNNIINYYEQSKAVAVVKEDMEVDYNNKKAQLAGHEAAIKRLEEKLSIQQLVQLRSNNVLDKKKQLGEINYSIAIAEADAETNENSRQSIPALKKQAEQLKDEIKKNVDELYTYQNTTDGLPVSNVLTEWINNVIEAENLRAKIMVMDERNKEFQQQYAVYAPAGANIKKIEREISVSEQSYLEILHGLNLAKLKLQDNELASSLKEVDAPYYPITAIPTNRLIMVIGAGFLGVLLVLGSILLTEYFDDTLRGLKKASGILKLPAMGMIPKIYLNPGIDNFEYVQNRLLDIITHNLQQSFEKNEKIKQPKIILFFSTQEKEGKSVIAGNVIRKLIQQNKKVIFINSSGPTKPVTNRKQFALINRLFGYTDPRINSNSAFLQDPADYLPSSTLFQRIITDQNPESMDYSMLLRQNDIQTDFIPDYIIIELPSFLKFNYASSLVSAADLSVLVCRANRVWSDADRIALDGFQKASNNNIQFIINGVEIQETEALLSDLPKKRSIVRIKMKNLFRFQFYTQSQF